MPSSTLTLNPAGTGGCSPSEDPWQPPRGAQVCIHNNSGAEQTLSNISPGLLQARGGPVNQITLADGDNWNGVVGNSNGTYEYNDGSRERGVRTGRIDPS